MTDLADLQAVLRDRADVLVDDTLGSRAEGARREARAIRMRRVAGAAAVAAVVVPALVAAMLAVNPLRRSEPPVDVPDRTPDVLSSFAGRTLLDSEVVQDGSELTLTYDTGGPSHWMAACFGVDAAYEVHMILDGQGPGAAACESEEPPEPQMGYVLDGRYQPGVHTLRVWLTRAGSDTVVTAPGSVLAAGVYELPEPAAVVAGIEVYERERAFTQEWRYLASDESEPGARRLVVTHRQVTRALAQLVTTDVTSDQVILVVDGEDVPAPFVLDGSGYLQLLRGGVSHTVELRLTGDVSASARLGIVWRTPA